MVKVEIDENVEAAWSNDVTTKKSSTPSRLHVTKSGALYCTICKYKKFESEEMHQKYIALIEAKEYYCHSHAMCTEKFTKHELIWHCNEHGIKIENSRTFFRRASKKSPKVCRRVFRERPKIERFEEPCEICFELFEDKRVLESHYGIHEDQYFCEVCKEGFKKVMDYVCHGQEHREDKTFACPFCELTTKKSKEMRLHIQKHEQFRIYKCKTCEKRFADHTVYKQHIEYYHRSVNAFVCDVCGKKLKTPHYLATHKSQHEWWQRTDDNEKQCTMCNYKFTSYRSMKNHYYSKHRPQTMFVCDVCGLNVTSKERLIVHLRRHRGDKRYKCSHCDKSFVTSDGKKEHERVHTGDKPYECPYCKKKFSQRSSMVIHSRSHTGERPYICHLCERGYTCKGSLDAHLKNCKGKIVN